MSMPDGINYPIFGHIFLKSGNIIEHLFRHVNF